MFVLFNDEKTDQPTVDVLPPQCTLNCWKQPVNLHSPKVGEYQQLYIIYILPKV